MKPPICEICGTRIPYEDTDKKGQGLVEFKKRPGDVAWDKHHKPEHPPYAEWFCSEHWPRAIELRDEPIHVALDILKREYGDSI